MGWWARACLAVAAFGLAACGSDSGSGTHCATQSDCPSGQECVDQRCTAVDARFDVPHDGDVADGGPCIDLDGDLHGFGCAAGLDCDDADPAHFEDCMDCPTDHDPGCLCLPGESFPCYRGPAGTAGIGQCTSGTRSCVDGHLAAACDGEVLPGAVELCGDGVDNDCNGVGDEETLGECGDCDLTCRTDGAEEPGADDPGSTGLAPNPDGPGVTLGRDELAAGYAWIANADEGTVSKLELETGVEAARFRVGLTGTGFDSPSRTAVDGGGDAYVACRAHMSPGLTQGSVTKMAGDRRACDDRNGDGRIETSSGAVPLALGRDECALWTVPLCEPGGIPRALAIDRGDAYAAGGYPWVGCWNDLRFWKLDPTTGAALASVDTAVQPYGAAVAPDGSIWVAGMRPQPGFLQRFDPATGIVDAAVSAEGTGCSSNDELARAPYGISVDVEGRVWVTSFDRFVCRYDPADGTWLTLSMPRTVTRGIAAGGDGRVWVANYDFAGNSIVSFAMADGSDLAVVDTGGVAPIGVGLDELGHVWTVNQSSNNASRYTRSSGVIETFSTGLGPYSYSDFTGYQRRTVVPRGVWTREYERCVTGPDDRWGRIAWDADVPPGASLTIVAASAATPGRLETATPVTLARVPTALPPADIDAAFTLAGVPTYRLLRLTVILEAAPDGAAPVLRSVRVDWRCSIFG
jgi:DNA-binding beta-propeller fold protein YncE